MIRFRDEGGISLNLMVLTKTGGILGPFANLLGVILEVLYDLTSSMGIVSIGMVIILFTIVIKLILLPLTINQQKSSKLTAVIQPEIQAIQKKYKGRTDNESMQRMNLETKAVYEKYGTSMTGGCLPLLIQMPILFALYRVMYNIPAYVSTVRNNYDAVISAMPAGFASSEAFQALAQAHKLTTVDYSNMDKVVDLLYKLTDKEWTQLTEAFPMISSAVNSAGENALQAISGMQSFLGMNIAYTPMNVIQEFMTPGSGIGIVTAAMAVLIPVLSGLAQWYSTKLVTDLNQMDPDNPAAGMSKSMTLYMPLMSVFFCFTFPLGIGIYWVASSVLQVIQQIGVNSYLSGVDIDAMIAKNVEKQNKKRAKEGLPPVKVNMHAADTIREQQAAAEREEASMNEKIARAKEISRSSSEFYNKGEERPGSLASKAAMVRKFNEKQNAKDKQ